MVGLFFLFHRWCIISIEIIITQPVRKTKVINQNKKHAVFLAVSASMDLRDSNAVKLIEKLEVQEQTIVVFTKCDHYEKLCKERVPMLADGTSESKENAAPGAFGVLRKGLDLQKRA